MAAVSDGSVETLFGVGGRGLSAESVKDLPQFLHKFPVWIETLFFFLFLSVSAA